MVNFTYNEAKRANLEGEIDFVNDDIRVLFVMTNTTADTEDDANTFGDFTTIDEFDGSGYSSPGVALATQAVNEDATNNRAEFDADDADFGSLSAGTRQIQGAIVYLFISALATSMPIAWIDTVGSGTTFPFDPTGTNVTIQWNAEGVLQQA